MIDWCIACSQRHEVGNDETFKLCPNMPVDEIWFWNPKDFVVTEEFENIPLAHVEVCE